MVASLLELSPSLAPQEGDHHFLYEIFRAGSIEELIPKGVTTPPVPVLAAAATAGETKRIKELEQELAASKQELAARMQAERTASAERVRALEAALAEERAEKKPFWSCFRRRRSPSAELAANEERELA